MEKKKFRFNVIDWIILLAVVVLIVFLVLKFTDFKVNDTPIATPTQACRITFFGEQVANFVIENTEIGDPALDGDTNIPLGSVVALETGEHYEYVVDNGRVVHMAYPDYSDLYLTVEVPAVPDAYGARVNDYLYGVGHTCVVRAAYGKYYLRICDIEFPD